MNYSTAIFLINQHVRAIKVTYEAEQNAPRTIFKTLDDTIRVDDFVIVPTNTRHKMTVCKVVEVDVDIDFDATARTGKYKQKLPSRRNPCGGVVLRDQEGAR